jgi:hypothetical protein
MNIFETTRQEIDDFVNNYIAPVEGYNFSQYETIKRIHLYDNSRFEDESDYNGIPKIFANIVSWRRDTLARFLAFKTRDYRLRPLNPKSKLSTLFLEKELEQFLKKNNIDQLENETAHELATFGSCVWKKTKKGAKIIDIRNLFLDPTSEYIENSRFVTIKYFFTPSRLRKKAKENGWDLDATQALIERVKNTKSAEQQSYEGENSLGSIRSTPYIEVFERWGEVDKSLLTGKRRDEGEMVQAVMIVGEPYLTSVGTEGQVIEEGAVLYQKEWKKPIPFIDLHIRKSKGRWLGIGAIEPLFPAQERWNELMNQKRVSMLLSSIHLFQTNDNTVVDNILSDLQSGDVIKTKLPSAIQPVANEERNLSAFVSEETTWTDIAERISNVSDLITGNQIPASTPATNALLQNQNSTSTFIQMRDRVASRKRAFYVDEVLPQLLSELTDEHILKFTGETEEIRALDEMVKRTVRNQEFIDSILNDKIISPITLDELEGEVGQTLQEQGTERFLKVKEHFYDDLEFEFDMNINNEQEDVATISQNIFQVFTALAQNPQILDDPVLRTLFNEYAERIGVSPAKLELANAERNRARQQQPMQPAI